MAKRPASSDDEGASQATPPSTSKKARLANGEANGRAPQRASRSRAQQAGYEDDDDGEGDDDEEEDNNNDEENQDEDDAKFEEAHVEKIRQQVQERTRHTGSVAESGIIESIEMHQFMCHKFLTFTFGPQINFIIGHNGSGKSAVLTAITVALGGKATTTGRGSGLKSFIREGQNAAEVTIVLKNRGDEAYRPDVYGKSIAITRKFDKNGTSQWKIRSASGKIISTKREELSAICDHMNIQVDNPMNVLTQDAARAFLSASTASDKYKFFLRGTQLSQLSDEYTLCLENITQTQRILDKKKDIIPELRDRFKRARERFQEANKALDMRNKVDDLKRELAWSHVKGKERELEAKIGEVARLEAKLPSLDKKLADAKEKLAICEQELMAAEAERDQLGDIEHLHAKKRELQAKLNTNKQELAEAILSGKQLNATFKQINKIIADTAQQIEEETRKMEKNTQEKRDEVRRRLEAADVALRAAEDHLHALNVQMQEKRQEADRIRAEGRTAQDEKNAVQAQIEGFDEQIARAKEAQMNALAPYGRNLNAVLERIKNMRWHGNVPVGPFGAYVKVKDPEKWAGLMRVQLGNLMFRFAVTDPRDRPALQKILKDSNNTHIEIIIAEYDLFDYSAGEPAPGLPTVLRQLEVSDPYVLRVLINAAQIERTFITEKRGEADSLLRSVNGGGQAWSADGFRVVKYPDGGGASQPLNALGPKDNRHQLFTGRDPGEQLRYLQNKREECEPKWKEAVNKERDLLRRYQETQEIIRSLEGDARKASSDKTHAKLARDNIRNEANQDVPANISGLEEYKAEQEEEKAKLSREFEEIEKAKKSLNEQQIPLLHEQNKIKAQIADFDEKNKVIMERAERAGLARIQTQADVKHYETKKAELQEEIAQAQAEADETENTFKEWTAKAEKYCERVERPRKTADVQRQLDSVQAALKEREERQGATVEQVVTEVNTAKATLESVETEFRQMVALNKALRNSLHVRVERWGEFRRHIALRTKVIFQYHLSQRGYFGKVLFDHFRETLTLKVQTEDLVGVGATQSKEKDPRSLSGGEKSFSTICLLLALWEAIGCPIRCLDEFDVFMDAVNRRISMKMMIEVANTSDRKQYVLITPQDMTNIHAGKTVRIHRMTDPERGQAQLNFGNA
ncbi:P-loop containing nucleoside triphosphate hydrolase protein [Punctularia strigosozonata HHB-11173 SS5]|uniref:P-loop containing nucleoside triphosphate hydrolase protein n=1 Tax=Punctularia strigosozonata (strain HHB-11173) TaxID=741275 RepID=UPI00044166CD|nr:P-loop containing nucleoside triphosphate hydrolase protein [Punctularia strigosozonata HHB-11173 SS5]EIN12535.1 P-loop containing nucleoside triphosphate hydrolase protein [Punctularia strigosozonata HHB-11173 SS5]